MLAKKSGRHHYHLDCSERRSSTGKMMTKPLLVLAAALIGRTASYSAAPVKQRFCSRSHVRNAAALPFMWVRLIAEEDKSFKGGDYSDRMEKMKSDKAAAAALAAAVAEAEAEAEAEEAAERAARARVEAAEAAGEVLEVDYSMAYVPSSPRVDRESLLEEAAAAREAEEEALEAKAEAEAKIAATEKMIANALEEVEEYKAMAEEAAEAATQAAAKAARLEAAAGQQAQADAWSDPDDEEETVWDDEIRNRMAGDVNSFLDGRPSQAKPLGKPRRPAATPARQQRAAPSSSSPRSDDADESSSSIDLAAFAAAASKAAASRPRPSINRRAASSGPKAVGLQPKNNPATARPRSVGSRNSYKSLEIRRTPAPRPNGNSKGVKPGGWWQPEGGKSPGGKPSSSDGPQVRRVKIEMSEE